MGQHNIVGGSVNKRPNPTGRRVWRKPNLCLVCGGPSAKFVVEGKARYRLAKTIIRITQKKGNQGQVYVHESPCLRELVQNWAKYIVQKKGLDALAAGQGNLQVRSE